MAGSVIGALRVDLGIDTATFSAGLKKAQSSLAGFGKAAAVGLAAAATAAVAAGAAFAVMGKNAIDSADAMSKTAQKAGLTTEALSRLNYAASYSDVSLEQLSGGLQKLARSMADVASGRGGAAATAFSALGISVTDAAGKLRDSDVVFAEIADKFSRLEDGSTKTALAVQVFGRAGAELIPLLNTGATGLKDMADESDRLGLTISTNTGRAAEKFNDTLTKVGKIIDGVVVRVAEAALPTLQSFADFLASPEFAQAAVTFGTTLLEVLKAVTEAIVGATNAARDLFNFLANGSEASKPLLNDLLPGEKLNLADRIRSRSANPATAQELYAGFGFGANGQMNVAAAAAGSALNLPTFSNEAASNALAQRLETLRQSLMSEEQAEVASHAKRLAEIQKFYADGAISKQEQDSLIEAAQQQHADKMTEIAKKQIEEETRLREGLVSNVAGIFGSLSTIAENFGEKGLAAAKAFGVAEAIVNTAQGITKALAQGGIFGFVGAAAVAASGAAQISTILSASKGSSSKPSVNGGASTSTPAVSAPVASETQRAVNITFQGLGRQGMEQFVSELNDALGDGVKLNLNPA